MKYDIEIGSLEEDLEIFYSKGGTLQKNQIEIQINDVVFPICSGGVCRSQTLWFLLQKYQSHLQLMQPHAARHGFDPYNGKINRERNLAKEAWYDEFSLAFGCEKSVRFGFDKVNERDDISKLLEFFNTHYYGYQTDRRKLYIAFGKNAHVVIHRLNSQKNLRNVVVGYIEMEDLISSPPQDWNDRRRSKEAYLKASSVIKTYLNLQKLPEDSTS
jgi:hypothetical protein